MRVALLKESPRKVVKTRTEDPQRPLTPTSRIGMIFALLGVLALSDPVGAPVMTRREDGHGV